MSREKIYDLVDAILDVPCMNWVIKKLPKYYIRYECNGVIVWKWIGEKEREYKFSVNYLNASGYKIPEEYTTTLEAYFRTVEEYGPEEGHVLIIKALQS